MGIEQVQYKHRLYDLSEQESDFATIVITHAKYIFEHLTGLTDSESWFKSEAHEPPKGVSTLALYFLTESLQFAKSQQDPSDNAILNINCLSDIEDFYLLNRFLNSIAPRSEIQSSEPSTLK